MVSLQIKTCICRECDLTGIPYWHSVQARKDPIGVTGFRKMPGRPKRKMIKAAHESPSRPNRLTRNGRTMTFGNCQQVGHNRNTCKNAAHVVQSPKRKRGRPFNISLYDIFLSDLPLHINIIVLYLNYLTLLEEEETNPKRPRRLKKTQFQSSINTPNVISSCPKASTRPSLSICTDETTRPPATEAARRPLATSRVCRRGRPLGKGQASRETSGFIKVKIIHTWKHFNAQFAELLEIIIANEKNLNHFTLSRTLSLYRPTNHVYKMPFIGHTTINSADIVNDDMYISVVDCDTVMRGSLLDL
ncbi:LOW QUALITY PROTEIN: hypothetical protein YC2023_094052 [Brassica napus]